MKRKRRSGRGGLGQGGGKGKGTRKEGRNDNDRQKEKEKLPPPPPPVIGTVATRTRRQKRDIATKWKQPISILINIMGYADPETIRMLCCVSKQFYDIIANDPGMEHNRAIPLLQISPAEDKEDDGRMKRLFRRLQKNRDALQRYLEIKIIDVHKFNKFMFAEMDKIANALQLYGIVSFNISSPPPSADIEDNYLSHRFLLILPNLRDVNLSNNGFHSVHVCLLKISENCPNFEKITWHNIDRDQSEIDINGWLMGQATNLKEIYMDESSFLHDNFDEDFSDLKNSPDLYLFYKCGSKVLERVSIRNAKWYVGSHDPTAVSQNALIKFVRKAPTSLKWFRSDLSHENMNMLRLERPGIELVN